MIDTLRSAELHARRLLLALRVGESVRIARALTYEACNRVLLRPPQAAKVEPLFEVMEKIAAETGSPDVRGRIDMARGLIDSLTGKWARSRALFEKAAEELARVPGSTWETATSTTYAVALCD